MILQGLGTSKSGFQALVRLHQGQQEETNWANQRCNCCRCCWELTQLLTALGCVLQPLGRGTGLSIDVSIEPILQCYHDPRATWVVITM